jgi:hypothetical protein
MDIHVETAGKAAGQLTWYILVEIAVATYLPREQEK